MCWPERVGQPERNTTQKKFCEGKSQFPQLGILSWPTWVKHVLSGKEMPPFFLTDQDPEPENSLWYQNQSIHPNTITSINIWQMPNENSISSNTSQPNIAPIKNGNSMG